MNEKVSVLLILLVSTLIAGCAPVVTSAEAEIKGQWEVVSQTRVEQPVRMAAFRDETFGLTGGADDAGKAHYTTDGGQSWTLADSSGGCLFSFDIVDDQTIWQCGYYATSVSRDGGQTWQATASEEVVGMSCLLSFADAATGWVSSEKQFKATADGGATWEELALPEGVSRVAAISLRTPTDGYLVDSDGILHVTQDGGNSWSSKSLKLGEDVDIMENFDNLLAAVRFFDADHGLVVLGLFGGGKSGMWALRTADGGEIWEEESLPVGLSMPYLSRDGKFLAVYQFSKGVTLLQYK